MRESQFDVEYAVRQFDYDTITGVRSQIEKTTESGLMRLFSLRLDFPTAWYKFANSSGTNFSSQISRDHFPYFAQTGDIELPSDAFELWQLDKVQNQLIPVDLNAVTVTQTLDQLNTDARSGNLDIEALDKDSDYFLLLKYFIRG